MSEKRKKKIVLSIKEKLQLVRKIKNGALQKQISLQYSIGESTMRGICNQKDKLMNFAFTSDNISSMKKRKTMQRQNKSSTYGDFDTALLQWVRQVRSIGTPISGPIAAKAKQFFKMLGLEGTFDALSGWMTGFKHHH